MGLVYHERVMAPPHRQVLRFLAGGVGFALPLSAVREIVPVDPATQGSGGDGAIDLAARLGLPSAPRFALLLAAAGPPALLVESMRGVGDLAHAEAFRLPDGVVEARPAPFRSALRFGDELDLELLPEALPDLRRAPAGARAASPDLAPAARELLAERGGERLAVPLPLVVQVLERQRVFPTPLAPAGLRGLLHHGRAIHPTWDAAALLGVPAQAEPAVLLLLDAGGTTSGVLVDRVLGLAEGTAAGPARRPAWDALLAPAEAR